MLNAARVCLKPDADFHGALKRGEEKRVGSDQRGEEGVERGRMTERGKRGERWGLGKRGEREGERGGKRGEREGEKGERERE